MKRKKVTDRLTKLILKLHEMIALSDNIKAKDAYRYCINEITSLLSNE
jgi:hypothetical protein